jgi:hypothetical protein
LAPRAPLTLLVPLVVGALTACVAAAPERLTPHAPLAARSVTTPMPSASFEAPPPPPPPPPRSPFAYANIDPEDDFVVGPPEVRPSCEQELAAAGVAFKPATLPIHTPPKSKITCGAAQVVAYRGSGAKIAYHPSVLLTCSMALALARFETILQEEASRTFGKRVVTIHHLGTYNCREMVAYPGWISEHSYANAIDVADFVLEDGRTVDIYKQFAPKLAVGKTPAASFLRTIASRAFREETFSSVLTPYFNEHHATHFHLDLARFRSDGTQFVEP